MAGASCKAKSFDAAELAGRAMALFDGMRNLESEAEWSGVLAAPKLTDDLACVARYHQAQSVFTARDSCARRRCSTSPPTAAPRPRTKTS